MGILYLKCTHVSCGSNERVWFPFVSKGLSSGLKPHPYCIHCGQIKNISSDKAKNIGYFINILSDIEKNNKNFTQVQKRLVIKELENIDDFKDVYSMTFSGQEMIFVQILKKYSNVSTDFILSRSDA